MNKVKAVSEWVVANKSWIYPAASMVAGWIARHVQAKLAPASSTPTQAPKA